MKKTLIKTIAVSAIIAGFGTASVFARSHKNHNNYNNPPAYNFDADSYGHHFHGNRMMPMHGMYGNPMHTMHGADILGTVTSIDDSRQLITVKDADGNEIKVHVNPFTRIVKFEKPSETPAEGQVSGREMPRFDDCKIELSEVKAGCWVSVNKFNTETKTAEAGHILVIE